MPSSRPEQPCLFTDDELSMLAKTADALTAYLGQPVLAEVGLADSGHEWVAFGIPLPASATPGQDDTHIQMGGPDARWVGNTGGMTPGKDAYDCRFLWAIELCPEDGRRYTKLDQDGEEAGWSDDLVDLLPFVLNDEELPPDDEDDDDDGDDEPPILVHDGGPKQH